MKEPPPYLEEQVVKMKYLIQSLRAGVVLAEIDSKGWSGVMAAKEEKVATMKEEIVSKHRKVEEQTNKGPPYEILFFFSTNFIFVLFSETR